MLLICVNHAVGVLISVMQNEKEGGSDACGEVLGRAVRRLLLFRHGSCQTSTDEERQTKKGTGEEESTKERSQDRRVLYHRMGRGFSIEQAAPEIALWKRCITLYRQRRPTSPRMVEGASRGRWSAKENHEHGAQDCATTWRSRKLLQAQHFRRCLNEFTDRQTG